MRELTQEEHERVSAVIKVISEMMGVTYGTAKEACLSAMVNLVTKNEEIVLDNPDALIAFKGLKEAGPGAMCEECGHFAGRHQEEAARRCWFPKPEGVSPCPCRGFAWLGFRFAMDSRCGPLYIKEKM